MNIIEAIKSGKDFRRKSWLDSKFFVYLGTNNRFMVRGLDLEINNGSGFYSCDLIADNWEVKEPEQLKFTVLHSGTMFPFENLSKQIKREEKMKFDPEKPVQQRNGRKAKIIYIGEIEKSETHQPIFAIMEDEEGYESVETFCTDGSFYHPNDEQGASKFDLVNIPEPEYKEINIHLQIYEKDCMQLFLNDNFIVNSEFDFSKFDKNQFIRFIRDNLKIKEK